MQLNENRLVYVGDNIYREDKSNGQRRYYLKSKCKKCNKEFFTDRYKQSYFCSQQCAGVQRGRPFNYKVSDDEKKRISETMTGTTRPDEVKDKIRRGVAEGRVAVINRARDHLGGLLGRFGPDHPAYKHGLLGAVWLRWYNIKTRCYDPADPAYKYYGEKGIKVCDGWMDYQNFLKWCIDNGYKKGLHIHRIDDKGDYGPDNCVLIDPSEHLKGHWATTRRHNNDTTTASGIDQNLQQEL